jgi:putative ABC transport system permease protein
VKPWFPRSEHVLDVLSEAALSLRDHRLRTTLSVLGIAIGIAAVILIGTVSRGGREAIFSELQTFGLRSMWVFRDRKVTDPRRAELPGSGIDNDDVASVLAGGCCRRIELLTPVIYGNRNPSGAQILARVGERYNRPRLEGVNQHYLAINNDDLAMGRSFTAQDVARRLPVAIIGDQVRDELFGEQANPVGRQMRISEQNFEVIGVLAHKDRTFLASIGSAGGSDANSRVLLPFGKLQQMLARKDVDVLQGQTMLQEDAQEMGTQLVAHLKRRHHGDYEYRYESMAQYVRTADRILGGVSIIGLVAAAVSLIVAGLGILNIMSTSVLERTREIGLRKALGGSERAILLQFLLESAMISTIGGIVGLVLGSGTSIAIAALTGFPLIPSVPVVVTALVVSIVVGLLSGYYPARRASSLRPVEALRYE